MFIERLTLRVEADRVGLNVIEPPVVRGGSGVDHRFSFMASKHDAIFAFDICEAVTETEVLRTYIKQMDSKVIAQVIYTGKECTESARKLAAEYRMRILRTDEIKFFFDSFLMANNQAATNVA